MRVDYTRNCSDSQPSSTGPIPEDLVYRPQGVDPLPCPRCGAIDTPAVGPGSGQHFAAARCRHCGVFLKWLSQYSPAERHTRRQQARLQAMAQRPPSPLQLVYLVALGDDPASPPAHMAEASARIDILKRGRVA